MEPFARSSMSPPVFILLALLASVLASCDGSQSTSKTPPDTRLPVGSSGILYGLGIEPAEAQKVGEILVREKYFGGKPGTVQLRYQNRRYQLRCVVRPGVETDPNTRRWRVLGEIVSKDVFRGAPVDIELCDESLKTLRVVQCQPLCPDLPIEVTFRPSVGGGSLVARYQNTSTKYLSVVLNLTNTTYRETKEWKLELGPGQTVEHGWLEGWSYRSGERIQLSHAGYEPWVVTVP